MSSPSSVALPAAVTTSDHADVDIEDDGNKNLAQSGYRKVETVDSTTTTSTPEVKKSQKTFATSIKDAFISISSKRFVDNEVGVDSEYAWVVDMACFVVQFFVIGNFFSFGVFLPVYVDAFNSNQQSVAWVGSIGSFLSSFLGILTGALSDRIGNEKVILMSGLLIGLGFFTASWATELWHLYLTHGFITGVGYSCGFISSVSVTGQWFKRYRGLAVGITMGGAGIGQFGMSQIAGKLIANLGWRSALRYLALINVTSLVLTSFVIRRRLPRSRHLFNMKNESEFLQNKNFLTLTFGYLFFIFGMMVPYTFLVIYAQKHGVTVGRSVLIFSLMGITNGFGRITFGEIADLSIGRLPMLRLSMILAGTATICWIACKTFESLLAFGLIYSFVAGGSVSIVPSAAADIFGVKKISSFLGILFTIGSVGNLLSSPIAGYMSDSYNSYSPAIILSGCCQILGSCLLMTMTKEEAADDSHSPSPASSHKPVARATNGDVISDSQASSVKVSNPRVISSGEEEEVIVTDEEIAIELTVVRHDVEVVQKEEAI